MWSKRFAFLRRTLDLRNLPTELQKTKALMNSSSPAVPPGPGTHWRAARPPILQGHLVSEASLPQRQPPALMAPGPGEFCTEPLWRMIPIPKPPGNGPISCSGVERGMNGWELAWSCSSLSFLQSDFKLPPLPTPSRVSPVPNF